MNQSVNQPPERPAPPVLDARLGLPSFTVLMWWLLLGRTVLAVTTLIQAALAFSRPPADGAEFARYVAFIAAITVVFALAVTGYAAYVVFVRRERPQLGFLQSQAAMDLLLVTALVHFAGAEDSGWAALYVLVLAIYGLLMPLRSGIVMALFGAALFLANATLARPDHAFSPGLWGQVAVFTLVFVVVAFLGQRLRIAVEEQSQLETELEQVRLEADEILRNIRSGVMTVDSRGDLAFLNPTAEQILGLDASRHLGRPFLEELERRAPELYQAVITGIRRGRRVPRAEGMVHRPEGRSFPIGLSTTTFERESETIPSVTAIFTDISDAQYLQELHLRAERLEAVAALSASLAHEIRNPLASIRSAVEQLVRDRRDDPDERLLGDLVLRESDRLSRLLGEFLDFSRVRASQFRAINLLGVVTDAVRLVREHPDGGAGIEIAVEGEPLLIQADEDLLHRTVWNLLLNAVQALKGQGKVTVAIDLPNPSELPRGAEFEQPVRLRVTDNGPGIDPDLRERLFQPFVSGRPGGSGLGLAVVQRAVEAHRGLVLLDSAPGQGTTFTILLHAKLPTEDVA
ncbi:MAG: PAS domain S-box protein [Gemmatimonadetes bacterium]|nr:PAS domain S-box protein [Gemmatimonadota bacterium]